MSAPPARPAAAVLVAAGTGERLGSGGPKALVDLAGEPLLRHAARGLLGSGLIGTLVVVIGARDVGMAAKLLEDLCGDVTLRECAGGTSRAESVRRGLQVLPGGVRTVAVHDAARPLVSADLVARTITALEPPWDAVAPALPVVDTLKLVEGDRVVRTVDRSGVVAVQTPQVFQRAVLARAHARPDALAGQVTDDLVLVEREGGRVRLVEGERANLKVTYPEDLVVAEALLRGGLR